MKMERLITPKELSNILGVSESTLAVWRAQKTYPLPYVKVGGRIRYDLKDIDIWLENRKRNAYGKK